MTTHQARNQETCPGKVKYPTEGDAHAASRALNLKSRRRFHPYKCKACPAWHVGKDRNKRKLR